MICGLVQFMNNEKLSEKIEPSQQNKPLFLTDTIVYNFIIIVFKKIPDKLFKFLDWKENY